MLLPNILAENMKLYDLNQLRLVSKALVEPVSYAAKSKYMVRTIQNGPEGRKVEHSFSEASPENKQLITNILKQIYYKYPESLDRKAEGIFHSGLLSKESIGTPFIMRTKSLAGISVSARDADKLKLMAESIDNVVSKDDLTDIIETTHHQISKEVIAKFATKINFESGQIKLLLEDQTGRQLVTYRYGHIY